MNKSWLCVVDCETSSAKPTTTQILSIAGIMLDPFSLEEKSSFYSLMKPLDWNTVEEEALKVNKLTHEELDQAPDAKVVFGQFGNWVRQYNKSRTVTSTFNAPILSYFNGDNFDLPIISRYCQMFGFWDDKRQQQNLFNQIYTLDVLKLMWYIMYANDELTSFKLTSVAEYLGYPKEELEKAHNALEDVKITAEILRRFINLSKYLGEKNSQGQSRLKIKNSLAHLFVKERTDEPI